MVQFLRDRNIWINDFGGKLGLDDYYVRIAISIPQENQKLQEILAEAINSGSCSLLVG